jgi:hypothetical protein
MGAKEKPESLNVKNGLYLKPVKSGTINVNGKAFRVPESFLTFIRVEGMNVYIADRDGKPLCKLEPVSKFEAFV